MHFAVDQGFENQLTRQDSLSVNAPPNRGPMTEEIPNIEEMAAMKMGLRSNGTVKPTIVMLPENKAEAPAPATARPIINMTEFLAAAQITEPSSKRTRAKMYVHLTLK